MAAQTLGRDVPLAYIYVFECGGRCKVGFSADVKSRLKILQSGNPFKINLIRTFSVPQVRVRAVEAKVHRVLRRASVGGEWFQVTQNQAVRAINAVLVSEGYFEDEPQSEIVAFLTEEKQELNQMRWNARVRFR